MESFEIVVQGKKYTIKPFEDDSFTVNDDGCIIGIIYSVIDTDTGVKWVSKDISEDIVPKIGERIENYYM